MKKLLFTYIFLFLVSLIFMGTVSAAADIYAQYVDSHNNLVHEVPIGSQVATSVQVQNDENPVNNVQVECTWKNNNKWTADESVYVSLDGGRNWTPNPSIIIWSEDKNKLTWDLGKLSAHQTTLLYWPGIPVTAGSEVCKAYLYEDNSLADKDTTSLQIYSPSPDVSVNASQTVGMQNTGTPLAALLMSLFMIFSGMIISKHQ